MYVKCNIANKKTIQYKFELFNQLGEDKNNIMETPPITLKIRIPGLLWKLFIDSGKLGRFQANLIPSHILFDILFFMFLFIVLCFYWNIYVTQY